MDVPEGWLILVGHQIASVESTAIRNGAIPTNRSTVAHNVLAAQLQFIDESGIEVQPVAQAYEERP